MIELQEDLFRYSSDLDTLNSHKELVVQPPKPRAKQKQVYDPVYHKKRWKKYLNMNKKSQFLTLGIIIGILLLAGFIIVKEKIEDKYNVVNYVGDNSTGQLYYLKTINPDCNVNEIVIHKNNIRFFTNLTEAEGFELDDNCGENN